MLGNQRCCQDKFLIPLMFLNNGSCLLDSLYSYYLASLGELIEDEFLGVCLSVCLSMRTASLTLARMRPHPRWTPLSFPSPFFLLDRFNCLIRWIAELSRPSTDWLNRFSSLASLLLLPLDFSSCHSLDWQKRCRVQKRGMCAQTQAQSQSSSELLDRNTVLVFIWSIEATLNKWFPPLIN